MQTSREDADRAVGSRALGRPETARTDGNRRRTVLVVEDSEVIRRVLTLILEADGYEVVESADGRRAADLARERRPDVITLDLSLPDVDGREILRSLKADASLREVPVVVLSAFTDCLTSSERWLAADVIMKPFDLDDLLERLTRAISRESGGQPGVVQGTGTPF